MDNKANNKHLGLGTDSIMPEEPDCVYLTERYKCNLLQVKNCIGAECRFCQTTYERTISHKRWLDVMNTMSADKQLAIAATYYSGKMPWKDIDG